METIVARLDSTNTVVRHVNRELMVMWINADLLNRADCDVRTSVVFYDALQSFVAAVPGVASDEQVERLLGALYGAGVRFWSRGIV